MKHYDFLKEYIKTPTPTGFENSFGGQQLWCDTIHPFVDNTVIDPHGTAYAVKKGLKYGTPDDKILVIDAHCDEISWLVNFITDKGYLKVIRNGGSDHQIAPSSRVDIWTDDQKPPITGVFGHPAIHVKDRGEPTIEKLFIDAGFKSKDEALEQGVEVGCPITMRGDLEELGENLITGHALDDKVGGYISVLVAEAVKDINLWYTVIFVNSVQEEIGLKGAKMAAGKLNPDMAICIDVCHDTQSPAYNKKKDGDTSCGEGAVLLQAPSINKQLYKALKETEGKKQLLARSPSSGTNTDSYAYHSKGCPSALLSIPMKYMHTTTETVHKDDITACSDILVRFITDLKEGDFTFF